MLPKNSKGLAQKMMIAIDWFIHRTYMADCADDLDDDDNDGKNHDDDDDFDDDGGSGRCDNDDDNENDDNGSSNHTHGLCQ